MLIPNFQKIIIYQWTRMGTYSLKTTSIHIIPVWSGSAVWNLRRSLDMNHWTEDLCGRWSRVGDLENADLDPGIKVSGSQKLPVQLVLPTACTRGCFETSNTYPPNEAKAIGLRIINMCINFLVFQCYFLCSAPLRKYKILILKKLSWMSTWFGDSTKLLKTNL